MDFGKLSDISGVDFSLPEEPCWTKRFLSAKENRLGRLHIGCPSWTSRDWVGKIYSPSLPVSDYLATYAQHFSAIELNVTYYHIPPTKQILSWCEKVGEHFLFCPKILQTISHRRRLKEVAAQVREFADAVRLFGKNLGVCFLQLPPDFTVSDYRRLVDFVKSFPEELRLAIEFRHPSWLDDKVFAEHIGGSLQEIGVGTVITDVAGRRDVAHLYLTASFVLVRFVGNELHTTDYQRLAQWAMILSCWLQKGIDVYFFIHQPKEKLCPETAIYFAKQVYRHIPTLSLKVPQLMATAIQGSLF